jgi:hypothetical protein
MLRIVSPACPPLSANRRPTTHGLVAQSRPGEERFANAIRDYDGLKSSIRLWNTCCSPIAGQQAERLRSQS